MTNQMVLFTMVLFSHCEVVRNMDELSIALHYIYLVGLKHRHLLSKSKATGLLLGNNVDQLCLFLFGKDLTNLTANSFPINSNSSVVGVPKIPTTLFI
jgi:hypothetical protein